MNRALIGMSVRIALPTTRGTVALWGPLTRLHAPNCATHLRRLRQEQGVDSTTAVQREREVRFRALYDSAYVDLLRFVRRRVDPTHAEDVVGEVMLVAWRRLDDVPDDLSGARAWLFGVARKTLQNARRRDTRADAVSVRLAEFRHRPGDAGQHPDLIAHRVDIAAAWPRLSALHQEAIALSVLDGLTAPEAASVLGISPTAFRLRLSRARRVLRQHVAVPADHTLTDNHASDRSTR